MNLTAATLAFALTIAAGPALAQKTPCTIGDIWVKSHKAGFTATAGITYMRGIGVLENRCKEPVGVQLKITGFDANDQPVQTREWWPASIRNILPGIYEFSLDQRLNFDRSIKNYTLTVIEVRRWDR